MAKIKWNCHCYLYAFLLCSACLSPAEGTVATNNDPVSEEPVTTTDYTLDSSGICISV